MQDIGTVQYSKIGSVKGNPERKPPFKLQMGRGGGGVNISNAITITVWRQPYGSVALLKRMINFENEIN
jgi:hypothetical protein